MIWAKLFSVYKKSLSMCLCILTLLEAFGFPERGFCELDHGSFLKRDMDQSMDNAIAYY